MIKITLNDTQAKQQLKEIAVQLKRPEKMYGVIGETLKKIHTQRFKDEKSPDGQKWQALSPKTLERKRKKGKSTKILRQDGYLSDELAYNYNERGVEFGSSKKYARLHHFGGKAGRGHKITIPARPWLGLNQNNEDLLVSKARSVLSRQIAQILR